MAIPAKTGELLEALKSCKHYFVAAGVFSAALNVLFLAAPLYMLQVNDRVVSSASVPTLIMLSIAVVVALGTMSALDNLRARILVRAGLHFDRLLSARVMAAMMVRENAGAAGHGQALRDLDAFRHVITGTGIHILFDAPWSPVYMVVATLLHPIIGGLILLGAIVLAILAVLSEHRSHSVLREGGEVAARNYAFTEASLRNSHVVEAMGMMPGLLRRWGRDRNLMLGLQARASDRAAAWTGLIRFLRFSMQSLMLGVGAWLVMERMVTPGVMFVSTLLLARALLPIEQAVGSWRQLVAAQQAYRRVARLLEASPPPPATTTLPKPKGGIQVQELTFLAPGTRQAILHNVNFAIQPGETLGIIGPSGAGKSTLARLLVGIHEPSNGVVRLDGASVATWDHEHFGLHVGYLPQEIELFNDTVAANIGRLGEGNDEAVIAAAMQSGAHEMILNLPKGYDTLIGEGGANLSGGHRQRIGLARAIYGDPVLVVLDEPSSNLDTEGDRALAECLFRLKQARRTVVMVSHRQSTLGGVDKILCMIQGAVHLFGSRQSVLEALSKPQASSPAISRAPGVGEPVRLSVGTAGART